MPQWVHVYLLDPAERAVSTFVQQFVVLALPFLVTGTVKIGGVPWLSLLDMSLFAVVVSLLTSVITFGVPTLPPVADLLVRVARTFVQSFLGVLLASQVVSSVLHAPWQLALATALPVAGVAALKGLAAMALPWSLGTASLLPAPGVAGKHEVV